MEKPPLSLSFPNGATHQEDQPTILPKPGSHSTWTCQRASQPERQQRSPKPKGWTTIQSTSAFTRSLSYHIILSVNSLFDLCVWSHLQRSIIRRRRNGIRRRRLIIGSVGVGTTTAQTGDQGAFFMSPLDGDGGGEDGEEEEDGEVGEVEAGHIASEQVT